MNPNMANRRGNFGGNNFETDFDQDFGPGPDYDGEMDDCNDDDYDNNFGWQNNGGRGGPGGFPRGGWGNFNEGPRNWGPPPPHFDMGPPPLGWGRGFGPNGPPFQSPQRDNRPMPYLMRCGIPKDRLMSLPKAVLRFIRPEYCGICDMEFESFSLSRAHYTSKGHSKRQNKWIAEYRPIGTRKNEMPMKSRDLYCELCDVQITSKVHATSHYDGKPHRAIVEGRKKAKNTALLARGMAGRLDQLIRREKKFIKSAAEVEKTEEEVEAPVNKVIQPELYCEICKTSVTCTEQMTMHLNGKRHLAKEKQHILKMMKGDTDKKGKEDDGTIEIEDDEGGEGVSANADAKAEAGGEGKAEGEGDKYDWGHGEGAWEEEEQQQPTQEAK